MATQEQTQVKLQVQAIEGIPALEAYIAAQDANKIRMPKPTTTVEKRTITCPKCKGTGYFDGATWDTGGECWTCMGEGMLTRTNRTRVWPSGTSEQDVARYEGELVRRYGVRLAKKALKEAQAHNARGAKTDAFITANPGLAQAFKEDHAIIRDLRDQLTRKGSLSEKQVALALKIAREIEAREVARANAPKAPRGRVTVTGEIVSTKEQYTAYGYSFKMLFKAQEGFKVWVSVPSAIACEKGLEGRTLTIKVTLKPSNDDSSFAFGTRPTIVG